MKKVKNTKKAWAISSNYTDIDGSYSDHFLGRYYFCNNNRYDNYVPVPEFLEGNNIALFETRKLAREYCKKYTRTRYGFPKAKVKRVKITIEEI